MPENTAQHAESVRLAKLIMKEDSWFKNLPASMRDELSQPNHDHHIATWGLRLARLIDGLAPLEDSGHGGVGDTGRRRDGAK